MLQIYNPFFIAKANSICKSKFERLRRLLFKFEKYSKDDCIFYQNKIILKLVF